MQILNLHLHFFYMKHIYTYTFLLSLILSCGQSDKKIKDLNVKQNTYQNKAEITDWHFKMPTDSTAGIGIEKALAFLENKKHTEVIVALIDGPIDSDHEDLRNMIYTNLKEIDGNGVDDDDNGYIDDIHGWCYVGKKDGTAIVYGLNDVARKIKNLQIKYDVKNQDDLLNIKDTTDKEKYKILKEYQEEKIVSAKKQIAWGERVRKKYYDFVKYYPEIIQEGDKYTFSQWDSIKAQINNEEIAKAIDTWKYLNQYTISIGRVNDVINTAHAEVNMMYNPKLNPYALVDDDPDNQAYNGYGHGFVNILPHKFDHATRMAGIIAAEPNNGLGVRGISPNTKIMPLVVAAGANEREKDFSNAVHYAVDNGARVINYSMAKNFVIDSALYYGAIKYATDKGVLFVCSGGNGSENHDLIPLGERHPTFKTDDKGIIKVGSSSQHANGRLVADSSNWGKKSIDIFAPGVDVLTTETYEQRYFLSYGTSGAAATVSGLSALIWSYYPEFTSSEIEKIIKESGTVYDVVIKRKEKVLNFKDMSQTGKVVNAYNAVLLADKMYKERKSN